MPKNYVFKYITLVLAIVKVNVIVFGPVAVRWGSPGVIGANRCGSVQYCLVTFACVTGAPASAFQLKSETQNLEEHQTERYMCIALFLGEREYATRIAYAILYSTSKLWIIRIYMPRNCSTVIKCAQI